MRRWPCRRRRCLSRRPSSTPWRQTCWQQSLCPASVPPSRQAQGVICGKGWLRVPVCMENACACMIGQAATIPGQRATPCMPPMPACPLTLHTPAMPSHPNAGWLCSACQRWARGVRGGIRGVCRRGAAHPAAWHSGLYWDGWPPPRGSRCRWADAGGPMQVGLLPPSCLAPTPSAAWRLACSACSWEVCVCVVSPSLLAALGAGSWAGSFAGSSTEAWCEVRQQACWAGSSRHAVQGIVHTARLQQGGCVHVRTCSAKRSMPAAAFIHASPTLQLLMPLSCPLSPTLCLCHAVSILAWCKLIDLPDCSSCSGCPPLPSIFQ